MVENQLPYPGVIQTLHPSVVGLMKLTHAFGARVKFSATRTPLDVYISGNPLAGVLVVGGTAPSGFYMEGTPARLPTTGDAAAAFLGGVGFSEYAAWDQRLPRGPGNVGMYPSGKTMPVVREGYIALISEVASPAQGAAIYARRVAAGGNTQLGAVTTVADGTNTIQLTNGYRFTGRNGTSGGLYVAEVEINLPT